VEVEEEGQTGISKDRELTCEVSLRPPKLRKLKPNKARHFEQSETRREICWLGAKKEQISPLRSR
jgi:hypothetical protein